MALCSHFLFLYAAQLDRSFHLAAVRELCRVADEIRIFPLLDLDGRPSAHLAGVRGALSAAGWGVELRRIDYEFQRGANQMLRASRDGERERA